MKIREDERACDCLELRCAMRPSGDGGRCNKFMGFLGIASPNPENEQEGVLQIKDIMNLLNTRRVFPICRDCAANASNAKLV